MSESPARRRILHLVVEGLPGERLLELGRTAASTDADVEIFQLTESTAREALEKIFTADTVAVWTELPL